MRPIPVRLIALASLGFALALPSQVRAATVAEVPTGTSPGPSLEFQAAPGEANLLTISSVPGTADAVSFSDAGASIAPGAGCTARADGSVVCAPAGLTEVRARLAGGDDRLDAAGFVDPTPQNFDDRAVVVEAGDGGDEIVGGDSRSCLHGQGGDDTLLSATVHDQAGICQISGGAGDDRLIGNDLEDFLTGGPGADLIEAGGGADLAGGQQGNDRLALGSGRDRASGGTGDDRVLGEGGPDTLNDRLGSDLTGGGAGDDILRVDFRTGAGRDELRGGEGVDKVAYLCRGCRIALNAAADDGQPSDDNVLGVENVTSSSSRYDVVAEGPAFYGDGDDTLIGDRRANELSGERGRDLIAGAGGDDRLLGGHGADRLRAADGERDEVVCGSQRDRATVDRLDRVRGCELVLLRR